MANAKFNSNENEALFGVFDGHGGREVAVFSNKHYEEILSLKKNLMNFSFQKSSGQLEKTSQIKNTRKNIARIKTKMSKIINGDNNA